MIGNLIELPANADKDNFDIRFIGTNLVARDGKNAWVLKNEKWEELKPTFEVKNE